MTYNPLTSFTCHKANFMTWKYGVTYNILTSTHATRQTSSQPASLYSKLCNHSLIQFMTYGMLWSSTLWPVYMPQGKHFNQPLSVVSCAVIHWFIYGLWYAVIFHSLTSTCATRQTSSQPASLCSQLCSHSLIHLWPMVCCDLQLPDQYTCHKANIFSTSLSL